MKQSEREYYYDDIYPSSLKRKSSILKRASLSFCWCFACLWHKLINYHFNARRLWNERL
ncbi:MAG: hypothetical protein AABY49_02810 [Planctomycetota bacterium]